MSGHGPADRGSCPAPGRTGRYRRSFDTESLEPHERFDRYLRPRTARTTSSKITAPITALMISLITPVPM